MTDRSTSVRLRAEVSGYIAGMKQAAGATKSFVDDAKRGTGKLSDDLVSVSGKAALVGGALLALPAAAVAVNMAFEKQMSNVQAVTGATAATMNDLRDAAIAAGQATMFSASDAASAEAELAKAGVSTADILGGALSGSLALAAAGQLDVATSASIAATAMVQFGLGGKDVGHIADLLAAGSNKAQGSVQDMGTALKYVGPVAHQMGVSLDETAGTIALLANNGILADQAGTSLRGMLTALTSPSKIAAKTMGDLGINVYDATGNFVGFDGVAGQLHDSLGKLTNAQRDLALGQIFGNEQITAARVLYAGGAGAVKDWTAKVNDSGAAARQAAIQMDNLAGDFNNLQSSIETGLIQSGSQANGLLRDMTQAATGAVNAIASLPGPTLAAATAVAVAGGAFLLAAPRIAAFNAALEASPALSKAAGLALRSIGPAIAVAAVGTLALDMVSAHEKTTQVTADLQALYAQLGQHITAAGLDDLNSKIAGLKKNLDDPGFIKNLENGIQGAWNDRPTNPLFFKTQDTPTVVSNDFTQQSKDLSQAEEKRTAVLEAVGNAAWAMGTTTARAYDLAAASGIALTTDTAGMTKGIIAYAASQSTGSVATQTTNAAIATLADTTKSAADALKSYKTLIDTVLGVQLDSKQRTLAWKDALAGVNDEVKKNGKSLDENTPKGRANAESLLSKVQAAKDSAKADLDAGMSAGRASAKYAEQVKQLEAAAVKAGLNKDAVHRLIDEFGKLPSQVTTTVRVNNNPALTAIADIKAQWAEILHMPTAQLNAHYGVTSTPAAKKAGGGLLEGPGTGTSDDIPMWGSNGEYVVTAAATDRVGVSFLDAINEGSVQAFAKGGHVKKRTTRRAATGPSARQQDATQIADSARSATSLLSSWDFSKYATAIQRVTAAKNDQADAELALYDARRKVNSAGTPAEQAAAATDLAAAEQRVATAKHESAAAEKAKQAAAPTGKNILAAFTKRAQKLVRFRRDLMTLKKRGLSSVILRQLVDAGIDQGSEMASALVKDGNIAALNREQAIIGAQSSALGAEFGAGATAATGGSSSVGTTGSTGSSAATQSVAISLADSSKPFIVKMDSTQVWKGLLTLKKAKGGASLGLG